MAERLHYNQLAPETYAKLIGFGHHLSTHSSLDPVLKALLQVRASQINRCHFCIEMHKAELRKHHEPETRIEAIVGFRDSDAFTPREKAALAWTETLTDLPSGSHASDEEYAAVRQFFDGKDLVDLTYAIALINAWNRMGVAFRPEFKTREQLAAEKDTEKTETAQQENSVQDAVDDDGGKVAQD